MKVLERGVHKEAKNCAFCGRFFTNRKKWKKTFDQILYCSDKCRKQKKSKT